VNFAARLLAAASDLSLTRVASATTAAHLCLPSQLVAETAFKGFVGLQPVYAW
jgi:adenylate cyclase